MSNPDINSPANEWKPLDPLISEDSLNSHQILADQEVPEASSEDSENLPAESNSLTTEASKNIESVDLSTEPSVHGDSTESESEEADLLDSEDPAELEGSEDEIDESLDVLVEEDDEEELADLPHFERLIVNSETGTVSGKPVENKHRKGTLPWIQAEHQASAKLLDELEEEFERNRNVLRIAIAMSRSSRTLKDEKLQELSNYQETRDSLAAWITQRQSTYAWTLLAALGKERDKLAEFEETVKNWTESTTSEIVETSRMNKRRFVRRIGFGFAGIVAALSIGALVNLFLGWLGITWLVTLLALIGFTNPFVWVPNFLIGGSIATWLLSLFSYFRSYMKWRKMVDRHVAEARYFVTAVKSLQSEKGRIIALHGQMEDYLKLLSEILHKPWEISDTWVNWSTPQLETKSLPTSLVVAKPLESGEYESVRKRALESFAATDWRSEQVRVLFAEYEKAQKMSKGAVEDRFDKDARLRAHFLENLTTSDLLSKVGDDFVQSQAKKLQSEDLPEATQFHVASLKPDLLESLDLSKSMFDDGQSTKNWTSFVGEILGKATAWSPLAYSQAGVFKRLDKQSTVKSYALIPDRIKHVLDASVKPVIMEGTSGSGVEVVVRVDISEWVEPNMVAILDNSQPAPSEPRPAPVAPVAPTTPEPTPSVPPQSSSGQIGPVTF
jgi:hypothetical protein